MQRTGFFPIYEIHYDTAKKKGSLGMLLFELGILRGKSELLLIQRLPGSGQCGRALVCIAKFRRVVVGRRRVDLEQAWVHRLLSLAA